MFNVAIHTVEFAINWLLQSSLLLAIGLGLGGLLRPQGSAVQSAVYRTTMVAVLVCPLATWGLARMGVSGWSVRLPREGERKLVGVDDVGVESDRGYHTALPSRAAATRYGTNDGPQGRDRRAWYVARVSLGRCRPTIKSTTPLGVWWR
jgi:hypothetical protein